MPHGAEYQVGKYVETCAYADGRLDIRWKGHSLPYTVFDKEQRVTHVAITENKRLGDVLGYIRERQEEDDKPKVKCNSDKNGYAKRVGKPGGDCETDEGSVSAGRCGVKYPTIASS